MIFSKKEQRNASDTRMELTKEYNKSLLSFSFPCSSEFPYNCPVTCCALTIVFSGTVGNIAVVASMIRRKLYKKTSHTCILVLALTDLLSLLLYATRECLYFPNEDYFLQNFGLSDGFCVMFFVSNNTPYLGSCWNVVFLAYERYVLVTNPLVYMEKHTYRIVLIRAVVAFILMAAFNVCYSVIMTRMSKCPGFILHPSFYAFISVPTILSALFLLLYFHCAKIRKLHRINSVEGRHIRNLHNLSNMTRTVYVIVLVFIVSQIPYLIFDVISIYESFEYVIWPEEYYDVILHVSIIVFSINYAINPFIYWITPLRTKFKRNKPPSTVPLNATALSLDKY
uniref:Neuromedin-U receptor 2-like n=1 Tax=Crassostrea virginica TaxID=6565 RepID=A0A8B8E085_CRAVI|nr:neuromedin-U receptor 2-like [Crassostrea virginica]